MSSDRKLSRQNLLHFHSLKRWKAEMNNCLLMLLHGSADLMAGISKQAKKHESG